MTIYTHIPSKCGLLTLGRYEEGNPPLLHSDSETSEVTPAPLPILCASVLLLIL